MIWRTFLETFDQNYNLHYLPNMFTLFVFSAYLIIKLFALQTIQLRNQKKKKKSKEIISLV